jgi:hypothetical protein
MDCSKNKRYEPVFCLMRHVSDAFVVVALAISNVGVEHPCVSHPLDLPSSFFRTAAAPVNP